MSDHPSLLTFAGIGKRFGKVQALSHIDFTFHAGECIGVAGHNGAGKSTLMAILAGVYPPSEGDVHVDGQPAAIYDANVARRAGVRCVFQELSLCANLTIAENMCVVHPAMHGKGWRRRANALMEEKLAEIFPGSGLSGADLVSDLTLTQRQMVEIARAFTVTDTPGRLIILDEPTSSLDAHTAEQLLTFVSQACATGLSCILITHMLGEVERVADRVMVMRDGAIVGVLTGEDVRRERIIAAMGHVAVDGVPPPAVKSRSASDRPAHQMAGNQMAASQMAASQAAASQMAASQATVSQAAASQVAASPAAASQAAPRFHWRSARRDLHALKGEVVGLAGLAGQGQTEALLDIFAATGRRRFTRMPFSGAVADAGPDPASGAAQRSSRAAQASTAFVAGDRARDGVFPIWSIAQNLDLRWLMGGRPADGTATRRWRLLIDAAGARDVVAQWRQKMGIRGASMDAVIGSLSGGNQQKTLFARALASDAELILMDDPTRGVDVGTKHDIYRLIRSEAAKGRTFIWYTTENEELQHCDRTYVFRAG
ncbi:MAG: ATP-binding cassette domain-containing protein, partial [Janthinobacterium lividum]